MARAQTLPSAAAVVDSADEHDASLIVLGSHRRAGLGGRVAGKIAADVATRTDRPVLIVHQDGAAGATATQPASSAAY